LSIEDEKRTTERPEGTPRGNAPSKNREHTIATK